MSVRDHVSFVPHVHRTWDDPALLMEGVTNITHKSDKPEEQWIVDTTRKLGDWRSKTRSTYMRWALAINGLLHAEEDYKSWAEDRRFQVRTIRPTSMVVLAEWSGEQAAINHNEASKLISGYGVADLFGCLEEIVFEAYRIFLDYHPTKILGGAEFKALRQLYHRSKRDAVLQEEWQAQWTERVENWQRKRVYDGLGKVFRAYVVHTEIRKPHWYKNTTPETWAGMIDAIGELRNLITHGAPEVSKALADFSAEDWCQGFDFREGQPLVVELRHMMFVECFMDQFLTAINASLIEKAMGPQPPLQKILG